MKNLQLITVYIPTKDRCQLLQRAVSSVLAQTYLNIELIIVDDGSTDETSDYLEKLSLSDKRVRYYTNQQSRGACYSRNIAIENANGHFVTGLDDDDEFLPHRLQSLVDAYDPKYAFICAGFYWDYGNYRKKVNNSSLVFSLSDLLNYNEVSNQVLVEKERLLAIDGFDVTFVACQDYDVWTRLMIKYGEAKRIKNTSYIVHRDKTLTRLTNASNWLNGHQQFMTKHQQLFSRSNNVNQQFKRLMVKRRRLGFLALLKMMKYGLIKLKLRYFIISNLKLLLPSFKPTS